LAFLGGKGGGGKELGRGQLTDSMIDNASLVRKIAEWATTDVKA